MELWYLIFYDIWYLCCASAVMVIFLKMCYMRSEFCLFNRWLSGGHATVDDVSFFLCKSCAWNNLRLVINVMDNFFVCSFLIILLRCTVIWWNVALFISTHTPFSCTFFQSTNLAVMHCINSMSCMREMVLERCCEVTLYYKCDWRHCCVKFSKFVGECMPVLLSKNWVKLDELCCISVLQVDVSVEQGLRKLFVVATICLNTCFLFDILQSVPFVHSLSFHGSRKAVNQVVYWILV